MSKKAIKKELEEALENRAGKIGIYVSKWTESLPSGIGCFNCFEENKIVCGLGSKKDEILHKEVLYTAYFWARVNLLKKTKETIDIDLSSIENHLNEIKNQFDSLSNINRECTNIEKSSENIRKTCSAIKENVTKHLAEIRKELEKKPEEKAPLVT